MSWERQNESEKVEDHGGILSQRAPLKKDTCTTCTQKKKYM